MKHFSEIISYNPAQRFGQPCIRGMRITVADILSYLAAGMKMEHIIQDFPELTEEDIFAALAYAADKENKIRKVS